MKKLTILLITFFMLASMVCGAIWMPLPILGKVDGTNVANLDIDVTNLRTGETLLTQTSSSGEFLVDAANFNDNGGSRYVIGDEFKIVIKSCSSQPECNRIVKYNGESELFSIFDLMNTGSACPITTCPSCSSRSCSSSVIYVDKECTTEDTVTYTEQPVCEDKVCSSSETIVTCPEEKVCEPTSDEDTDLLESIIKFMLGGLLGATGIYFFKKKEALLNGVGIKMYTSRTGVVKLFHKHPGILGYHDPKTLHRELHEKHKKGEINPSYKKDDNGIYCYEGGD